MTFTPFTVRLTLSAQPEIQAGRWSRSVLLENSDPFTRLEGPVGIRVVILLHYSARGVLVIVRIEDGAVPFALFALFALVVALSFLLELDHEGWACVDEKAIVVHVRKDVVEIREGFEVDL